MSLAHLLLRHARQTPERAAIFSGTVVHATYGQWAARSAALAQRLQAAGLAPGERVVLFMRNHPRYLEILWAAWWAGLVVVPVNAKLHAREVEWIIDNAQARWAFVTTGRPKGVMLTHRNLMTMGLTYFVDVDPVSPADAIVYGAPMSHGAGIYAIPHLMAGARHVVPASGGVDPEELFALGRVLAPLSAFAAPTIVKRLVDHAEVASPSLEDAAQSFKTIVYGGAPMYAADIARATGDGAALRANLRTGRNTHGGHHPVARSAGRRNTPALWRTHGVSRRGATRTPRLPPFVTAGCSPATWVAWNTSPASSVPSAMCW